ncbi:phospholipase, partial [Bacillus nitratireducens]|nr:phospholipase [Bacillus nitratireducens]
MKKKVLALAAAITLAAPLQNVAFAHENDGGNRVQIIQYWSAEDKHSEGVNSHL